MKKLILACFLILPLGANAAVADKLLCAFKVERQDRKTKQVETIGQAQGLYSLRQEVRNHPFGSNITITEANTYSGINITNNKYTFDWFYNIQYRHALMMGYEGKLIAQQRNCVGAKVKFCPAGRPDDCMISEMGCENPDSPPFNNTVGGSLWKDVGVIEGLPTFDEKTPLMSSMSMEDRHGNSLILNMECQYKGTYQ